MYRTGRIRRNCEIEKQKIQENLYIPELLFSVEKSYDSLIFKITGFFPVPTGPYKSSVVKRKRNF